MHQESFKIKTDVFEGPLDLLLHLIEKRKLLINDVSLADVTDDFISHIKQQVHFPVSQATHFVYIAATLLLIKSKSLLPMLQLTSEEESNVEDLEKRLLLYKFFKELSDTVRHIYVSKRLFFRSYSQPIDPIFAPPKDLSKESMHEAALRALSSVPKRVFIEEARVQKVMSLEDMVSQLRTRIESTLKTSFHEFSGYGKAEKAQVIVSFLAMLELVKQEIISVQQDDHFSDIHMENQNVGVPQYGNE